MTQKRIILATHVYADGPSQAMKEYLTRNKYDFLWLAHPLFYDQKLKGSGFEIYKNGEKTKEKYAQIKKILTLLGYLKNLWLNIYYGIKIIKNKKYDLFIGYNNLNALSGLILKKLGKVKKTVYFVIDYTPKRFNNKILNWLYHWLDRYCVKNVDETWNLNEKAMNDARLKYHNFNAYNFSVQRNTPMGFWKDRMKIRSINEIEKHTLVFMGHLLKKQGVQFVLQAIPLIIKEIPNFKFLVIGGGKYMENLQKLAKTLDIEKHVEFTGFVENHEQVEDLISKTALAIAIYEKGNPETNFTYYTDQGKLKAYLGSGVPIILSDTPSIAKEIEKNGAGMIINEDKNSIARAVISILKDEKNLKKYRENAVNYAKQFDWNIIFSKNIFNKA